MLNLRDAMVCVVEPVLKALALGWEKPVNSPSAHRLMVYTLYHESHLGTTTHLTPTHGGTERGLFQVTASTADWLDEKIQEDEKLHDVMRRHFGYGAMKIPIMERTVNLAVSCALARLKYWYDPKPLPAHNDTWAMAEYWGRVYQSQSDPQKMRQFRKRADSLAHQIDQFQRKGWQ